jgi:hypothetical protein
MSSQVRVAQRWLKSRFALSTKQLIEFALRNNLITPTEASTSKVKNAAGEAVSVSEGEEQAEHEDEIAAYAKYMLDLAGFRSRWNGTKLVRVY